MRTRGDDVPQHLDHATSGTVPPPGGDPRAGTGRPGRARRIVPVLGLFLLSPLVAEFLLGNIAIDQLWLLPILVPMYGGGAVLVREVARRTGRGWPTILTLAVAYGLVEEGILDQMLFNPSYFGLDLLSTAYVPAFGIGAQSTVTVLAMHAVWSIGIPIALVEALTKRGTTPSPGQGTGQGTGRRTGQSPWLGRVGLTVTGVLFVVGSALVFYLHQVQEHFLATAPQLVGTSVVIGALVVAAFTLGRTPRRESGGHAPRPWQVGVATFVASSAYFLAPDLVPAWVGVGIDVALAAVACVVLTSWSRRREWGSAHTLAAATGALATYVWLGFGQAPMSGSGGAVHLLGNTVLSLGAIVLLVVAWRRIRDPRSLAPARTSITIDDKTRDS